MRNGLNISGVSELVHEIQERPEEALIRFAVASGLRDSAVAIDVLTGHHGTERMARGFGLWLRPADGELGDQRRLEYTPAEAAVAALGACVLVTHVVGFTARGVNLGGLHVSVTAEQPLADDHMAVPGTGFESLRYEIDVDCEAEDEMVQSLTRFATCFSPNHRVFLDEADVAMEFRVRRRSGEVEDISLNGGDTGTEQEAGAATATIVADLTWEYGSESWAVARTDGEAPAGRKPLAVDQPKQMLGISKAPNPQETLLAAICGELVTAVRAEARRDGLALRDVSLTSRGQLDIRGMQNIRRDIPPRFHGLGFDIEVTSDAPVEALRGALARAVRRSSALASLYRPNAIDVRLARDGRSVLQFESTRELAEKLIDELAAQQAAAAAAAKEEAPS